MQLMSSHYEYKTTLLLLNGWNSTSEEHKIKYFLCFISMACILDQDEPWNCPWIQLDNDKREWQRRNENKSMKLKKKIIQHCITATVYISS